MTYAQRLTDKRITRAIMEYRLIEEGDRLLVALSGGKDSIALAWNLARKARGFPVSFTVEALHLVTGFAPSDQPQLLTDLLSGWGMKLSVLEHPAAREAKNGNPPTCFGCARDRRRMLLGHAASRRFNKVALGHHMDAASWLEMITGGSPNRKLNLWKSLTSQKTALLPIGGD